jgi:hypothetical protein
MNISEKQDGGAGATGLTRIQFRCNKLDSSKTCSAENSTLLARRIVSSTAGIRFSFSTLKKCWSEGMDKND